MPAQPVRGRAMITDEEIIREAFADYQEMTDNLMGTHAHPGEIEPYAEQATKALSAFQRVMSRCIPELPEGWNISEISQWNYRDPREWHAVLHGKPLRFG